MELLAVALGFKGASILAVVCVLAGGVGGFLYGGKVEAKAQAKLAQAKASITAEVKKL